MNNKNYNSKYVVYFLITVLAFVTIYVSVSYGIFAKKDYLTDLNIIAGDLAYKIDNQYLKNNSITLQPGEEHKIVLNLTSLNKINTKYELYYLINNKKEINKDVKVVYTSDSKDSTKGIINAGETKEITINLKNESVSPVTITIGCEGGLTSNNLVISNGNSILQIQGKDTTLAYIYKGTGQGPTKFPEKDDGYYITDLKCTGGTAKWNNDTWAMEVLTTTSKELVCEATIANKYRDNSGAAMPVIKGDLIPINIGPDGTATKADIYGKWYDYNNKQWANAVILEDKSINYSIGQVIPESNIQSYFVWIPRYKYKLFNVQSAKIQPQEIEIQFENKTTIASTGTQNGEWLTHPAFTSFDVNGIWVGKFESSYKEAKSQTAAQVNKNDASKLIIKPNLYSWRNITISNAFNTSFNYKRNLDSHMMKNTEWGVAAYLSHSKYGQCTSGKCKEIMINNNKDFITGLAANNSNEIGNLNIDNKWNTIAGTKASTTGNITGIYDMAGGSYEYVMGYLQASNYIGGSSGLNQEWFNNINNKKYFDNYKSNNFNSKILGDGIGEVLEWYNDKVVLFNSEYPWIHRGSSWNDGINSGIFSSNRGNGSAHAYVTFRVVLAPQ